MKAHPAPPVTSTKYDDILKKDPHNGPALVGRAHQLELMGRSGEAESAYIQAILVVPESFEAHFHLGHLYLADHNFVPSKDHYKSAQAIAEKAKNTVNNCMALRGLADAEMQEGLSMGDFRLRTQAFAIAETHIKQAIVIEPKEADFKIMLGRIYESQAKFKEAGNTYREMLAASPDSLSLYARLANTYKAVHDIPEYVKVWKQYQARQPEDPTSYEYITEMYNQSGKYQEAADTLRGMLSRKLTNSVIGTATVILGQDLIELKHMDEARGEFKNVLAMAPSPVPAKYMLVEKATLETAQRQALNRLAGLESKENKFDQAIVHLVDLKKREAEMYRGANQPPDGEVFKNIATLYERGNHIDKAIAEYEDMAKALPSDPIPHDELGIACWRAKRRSILPLHNINAPHN